MDWTAKLPAASGAGPVSVTATNVEIGNRRWSTRLTVSNLGHVPLSLAGIALLRYDSRYYSNPLGFTTTSRAKPLVRAARAGQDLDGNRGRPGRHRVPGHALQARDLGLGRERQGRKAAR